MRITILASVTALGLALYPGGAMAAKASLFQTHPDGSNRIKRIPHGFIVEYEPAADGSKMRRRDSPVASVKGIKVIKPLESSVFTGASIVTDKFSINELQDMQGIARVWPNMLVQLPPIKKQRPATEGEILKYTVHNVTGVSRLHRKGFFGKGCKIGIVDTGVWYMHKAVSTL